VGALAYLLKNRFYLGEVVYRGDIHRGEHEPILDPALFEAVQAKLATQAVGNVPVDVELEGAALLALSR
jgi:site-specific DNA recombinase